MVRFLFYSSAISGLVALMLFLPINTNPAAGKIAWELICKKAGADCYMASYIRTNKNKVVSAISIQKIKNQKLNNSINIAIIQLPLGLHIPSGVILKIDDHISIKAKLIDCYNKGCRAMFTVSDKIKLAMQKGSLVSVFIVDSKSRNKLLLSYSLIGFTKTWQSMLNMS